MSRKSDKQKKYDSKEIYSAAAQFNNAARLMDSANAQMRNTPSSTFLQPYLLPSIVCWALCIELFLKCLIHIETGNTVFGHEFSKLYDSVSKESKEFISKEFNRLTSTAHHKAMSEAVKKTIGISMSYKLDDVIAEINNVFVQWRYVFENRDNKSVYCLDEFHRAIRYRIINLKPEYDDRNSK